MTQDEFMVNMIDKGWVKVKAKELREYIKRKEMLEIQCDTQEVKINKLCKRIEELQDRLDNLKLQELFNVDLKA